MPKRKLKSSQVEEIFRQYYYEGRDEFYLARFYGVDAETIRDIINRRTWKKLDLKTPKQIEEEKMQIVAAFEELLLDGHSIFEVAMMNNCTPHEVMELLKWGRDRR